MTRITLLFALFFWWNPSHSQIAGDVYLVYFSDKQSTEHLLSSPDVFLSQRSLERRQRQQIAIRWRDLPVDQQYVNLVRQTGAQVRYASKWLNAVVVDLIDSNTYEQILDLSIVGGMLKLSGQRNAKMQVNDKFGQLESPYPVAPNESIYGSAIDQIKMLNGDLLHSAGYQGEDMLIAVLDAGFRNVDKIEHFTHLFSNDQLVHTFDFVELNDSVFEDNSHGTNVLSTMTAKKKDVFVGTAPEANYLLFRTENASTEFRIEEANWIAAAELADSLGADIINTSLGYSGFDDTTMNYSLNDLDGNTALITRGADWAASTGMLIINSAGNQGNGTWGKVTPPADGDSVFTIGAVDMEGDLAAFSSRGPTTDNQIKPDVVAVGLGTAIINSGGAPVNGNGTSFSSPVICGMAACLWQAFPEKTNMEIVQAIRQSASQADAPDNDLGYGIPNFFNAWMALEDSVLFASISNESLQVLSNPDSRSFNVLFGSEDDQTLIWRIFDTSGKQILQDELTIRRGNSVNFQLDLPMQLASGTYIMSFDTDKGRFTRKISIAQ